ncbi:hypothetical protein E2562_032869 [Oryza meyeriana var. granulata]|uniref:Uncharacterized protein n=1 Tax=Oryza meyeriana var. granulata TaxID=110450 RepID=A0A6G1BN67_9ORYZ|nr:hypothetical protein E2562_032869 [Oryza meyeriana var. granulata]
MHGPEGEDCGATRVDVRCNDGDSNPNLKSGDTCGSASPRCGLTAASSRIVDDVCAHSEQLLATDAAEHSLAAHAEHRFEEENIGSDTDVKLDSLTQAFGDHRA